MEKIPCEPNCPKRSESCHSECIDYAIFAAVNEIKREQRNKEAELLSGVYDYQAKGVDHAQKKKQRKFYK